MLTKQIKQFKKKVVNENKAQKQLCPTDKAAVSRHAQNASYPICHFRPSNLSYIFKALLFLGRLMFLL